MGQPPWSHGRCAELSRRGRGLRLDEPSTCRGTVAATDFRSGACGLVRKSNRETERGSAIGRIIPQRCRGAGTSNPEVAGFASRPGAPSAWTFERGTTTPPP